MMIYVLPCIKCIQTSSINIGLLDGLKSNVESCHGLLEMFQGRAAARRKPGLAGTEQGRSFVDESWK